MSNSSEHDFEYIEVFCSLIRSKSVVLSLRLVVLLKGGVATGGGVSCDCHLVWLKGIQCLLVKRITGRKRK